MKKNPFHKLTPWFFKKKLLFWFPHNFFYSWEQIKFMAISAVISNMMYFLNFNIQCSELENVLNFLTAILSHSIRLILVISYIYWFEKTNTLLSMKKYIQRAEYWMIRKPFRGTLIHFHEKKHPCVLISRFAFLSSLMLGNRICFMSYNSYNASITSFFNDDNSRCSYTCTKNVIDLY